MALRLVRRAQIIWRAAQGLRVPAITRQLGSGGKAVRQRLKRFETVGWEGWGRTPPLGPAPHRPRGGV